MTTNPPDTIFSIDNETSIQGISLAALYTANSLNLTVCPENVYSEDQKSYRVYANLPISLFGILSNIVNIIVFADSEMHSMLVNHFLLALSISDLILLIANLLFLILPVFVGETHSFFWNDTFPVIIRYAYPLALTAQTAGVYLTVLVSVHRFLGVCYPFKAKRWVTRKPVQIAIVGSILFSVIINVPTFFELYVLPCYSERFRAPSQQIALAEFNEMTYIVIKKTIIYTLVMFVIPFATLIFVNCRIIVAMRESSNLRNKMNYSTKSEQPVNQSEMLAKNFRILKSKPYAELMHTLSKIGNTNMLKPSTEIFKTKFTNSWRDRSVTLMLLAIVALFLSLNSLAFCNSIFESIMMMQPEMESHMVAMFENSVEISNVLITLSSSTSSLVYIIFSSKYRMIFKSLCGISKRVDKLNRIALSTGIAAQRMAEFSLVPDEVERRRTKDKLKWSFSSKRRGTDTLPYCLSGNATDTMRRKKLFRTQNTLTHSLTNSDLNLRLIDDKDIKKLTLNERRTSKASLPEDNLSV